MTIPTEKLRAIEARTEHAVVHTLRLMAQEIVTLCSQSASADRGDAGMSLLKVEGLDRARGTVPAGESDLTVFAMPTLSLTVFESPLPKAYRVFFYEREYGDLEDVVTVDSFEAGVQLVRDRLAPDADYAITAAWVKHEGEMTVATPHGTVLARVEADDGNAPTPRPDVRDACGALRSGDASNIERLFGRMLEAA